MNRWMTTTLLLVACAVGFAAGHGFAEEGEDMGFPLPEWMQKGPEHATLAKSAGEWDVTQTMWMVPGQPPVESKATSSASLLWDGRFVQSTFHGDMMGTPFEGHLLMAFDRVDKEYVAVWIDSMSTYLSVSRGTEKDGVTTFKSNDPDFMTGQKKPGEMVMKWIDDDTYTLTFQEPTADGAARTTMVMTYKRRKAE